MNCKSVGLRLRRRIVQLPPKGGYAPLHGRDAVGLSVVHAEQFDGVALVAPASPQPSDHEQSSRIDLGPRERWRRSISTLRRLWLQERDQSLAAPPRRNCIADKQLRSVMSLRPLTWGPYWDHTLCAMVNDLRVCVRLARRKLPLHSADQRNAVSPFTGGQVVCRQHHLSQKRSGAGTTNNCPTAP